MNDMVLWLRHMNPLGYLLWVIALIIFTIMFVKAWGGFIVPLGILWWATIKAIQG